MAVSYDVIREILVRVKDLTTLFRCAVACKALCRLVVADDYFLRRRLPEKACGKPPFAGFFAQLRSPEGPPAPCFVPAPHLGLDCRFLSSFFPNVRHAGIFDYAVPLTSRHGLLLARLDLHRAGVEDTNPSGVLLAVCDPVARKVHELPPLEHYWDFDHKDAVDGYALLSDVDCYHGSDDGLRQRQRSRFFKVLIVTMQKSRMRYRLHTFSSTDESGRWNTCSGVLKGDLAMLRQQNAVVCGGAAHWLLGGKTGIRILHVSAETGQVTTDMTDVEIYSFRHEEPYLSVSGEGKLMVLILQKGDRELEIWTSHDNDMKSFKLLKLRLRRWHKDMVYTCLGEKLGMVLVKDNRRNVYVTDLKTGVMREVTDWPRSSGLSRRKTMLLDIDWPSFFGSRLAFATK